MKRNQTNITGCLSLAWLLLVMPSPAAANIGISLMAGCEATSQIAARSESSARSQANQLLAQAQEAMQLGNLDLAAQYLRQAEMLNVDYNGLLNQLDVTPEKVRRDLEILLANRGGRPETPSQRFTPPASTAQGTQGSANPLGARSAGTEVSLDRLTDASKSRAVRLLSLANVELQKNNLVGAIGYYQQAVAQNAQFNQSEYSPDQLKAALLARNVDPRQLVPNATINRQQELNPNEIPSDTSQQAINRLYPPNSPTTNDTANSLQGSGSLFEHTDSFRESLAPINPATSAGTEGVDRNSQFSSSPAGVPPSSQHLSDTTSHPDRAEATRLMAQARLAMSQGNLDLAETLIHRAKSLNVPESAFYPNDILPWSLDLNLQHARQQQQSAAVANGYGTHNTPGVAQGIYHPGQDPTYSAPAQSVAPAHDLPEPLRAGLALIEQGEQALTQGNVGAARQYFEQAWMYQGYFDATVRQRLHGQLQQLRPAPEEIAPGTPEGILDAVDAEQQAALQQVFSQVTRTVRDTLQTYQNEPFEALQSLRDLKAHVDQTSIDAEAKRQMLMRIDRNIATVEIYIDQNRAQISLDQANADVLEQLDRERRNREEVQIRLAEIGEQFNQLIEQQRYAEAVVLSKQARELDPHNPFVVSLVQTAQFNARLQAAEEIERQKEEAFVAAMADIEKSSIAYPDNDRPHYPHDWESMTARRQATNERNRSTMSAVEREIQESLKKPIEVHFENRPLSEVISILQATAGVNIYLDPQGLAAEGVTSDTPITINLATRAVSLKSALNLILQPLRLDYVIQDEVLRITSEQVSSNDLNAEVYNVADLVIPIPNFVPSYNIGIPAALQQAVSALGHGRNGMPRSSMPLTMVADSGAMGGNDALFNQYSGGDITSGPGGMGGGVKADFDTLIELITNTIEPNSWGAIGGPGAIQGFDTNMSLVITQTQEIHEKIVDLLEQLRRLQDLQVTIEVRFISLSDNFFERIGVDFDFDIDDGGDGPVVAADDSGPSLTIGLGQPTAAGATTFTGDFDLSYNAHSYGVAVPAFGTPGPAGLIAGNAANFGFAILSDIEAFFFIQALQGDHRSNILQAPKVTLFNGQQAFVSNTQQRPFVTGLVPVVGDFAAAHQPVVIVLSEGTSLSVQAVVSPDRRFVRLTLIPFFSEIGKVDTFTFSGSKTTNSGTTAVDPSDPNKVVTNEETLTTQGSTIQLPTFAFTTVTTTVSVPDGGTILLGGIKALSEGRNELGVPMLSKIPYVNRLFRNVGISRSTSSLMMMVTPRIIIQEEEESLLGITN